MPTALRTTPGLGDARRWSTFLVGLACLVTGIALSITADLGVGSWQVLETGLVVATGAPFGVVAFLESVVALALAWVWLDQRPWIATVVLAFAGVAIGALLAVLDTPGTMTGQLGLLAVGITLLTIGVAFYLAADLGASAQDALFVGLYRKYPIRPGLVRFGMDATLVVTGLALGGQFGVGTFAVTLLLPLGIEPALRVGHRLAGTAMHGVPPAAVDEVLATRP